MVEGREIGCQCRGQLWDHGSPAKPTLRYRQTHTQAYMHSHIGIRAFLHTYMYVHLQQPSSLRVKPCPFPVVRLAFHRAARIPALGLLPCDCWYCFQEGARAGGGAELGLALQMHESSHGVFVCWGSRNKYYRVCALNSRCSFPHSSGSWRSDFGVLVGGFPLSPVKEGLFPRPVDGRLLPGSAHGLLSTSVSQLPLFIRTGIILELTLMTSF